MSSSHGATCPVCGRAVGTADSAFRPFCSERCRNVDLVRWAEGKYAITEFLDEHDPRMSDPAEDWPDDGDG